MEAKKSKEDTSKWKLPLGDYSCLIAPNTKTLVIALDVSASMSSAIKFLQKFLEDNERILKLFKINEFLLVVYSDYDRAPLKIFEYKPTQPDVLPSNDACDLSTDIKLFVQKALPLGISQYKKLIQLTNELCHEFREGTPETLLAALKNTPKSALQSKMILQTTVDTLIAKIEEYIANATDSPKYCTPQAVATNINYDMATVAVPLYSTVEEIIQFLKNHVRASMLGTGGDLQEAGVTVAACIANACKNNPGKCCVVFITDDLPHIGVTNEQRAERRTLVAYGVQDPSPVSVFGLLHDLDIPVAYISTKDVSNSDWINFRTNISIAHSRMFENPDIFTFSLIEALNFFFNGSDKSIIRSSSLLKFHQCQDPIALFKSSQSSDHISNACKFYGRAASELSFRALTVHQKAFYYAIFVSEQGLPTDSSISYSKVSQTVMAKINCMFPSMEKDQKIKHIAELVSYVTLDAYLRKIDTPKVFNYCDEQAPSYSGTLVSNTTQMNAERASRVVEDFMSLIDKRNLGAILGLGLLPTRTMISQFFMAKRFSPEHIAKWSTYKNKVASADHDFASLLSILFDAKITRLASEDTLYIKLVEYLVAGSLLDAPKGAPIIKYIGNPAENSVGVLGESYLKFLNPSSVNCFKSWFAKGGWKFATLDHTAYDASDYKLTQEEIRAVRESYPVDSLTNEDVSVDLGKHTPEIKRKLLATFRSFLPVAQVDDEDASPSSLLFRLMQLSIGMAVKEKYVPTITDTLKILAGVTVYGANDVCVDPSYRQMAAQIVNEILPSSNTFKVLFERPSESTAPNETKMMESASWLTSQYAIEYFTPKLFDCIYVDQGVRDRIVLIQRLQCAYSLLAKCPPSVQFDSTHEVESTDRNYCVWGEKCPSSGHIVPSAFVDERDSDGRPVRCVYCTVHPSRITLNNADGTRTEADNPLKDTKYHDDGTPHIDPDVCIPVLGQLLIPAIDNRLETECTKCGCFYPILDTRKIKSDRSLQPRCVLCRRGDGSVSNPTTFKKQCDMCSRSYVFASDRALQNHEGGKFRCGTCYLDVHFGQKKRMVSVDYSYQTRSEHLQLALYLNGSPGIRKYFAALAGLTPMMVRSLVEFYLQHSKKLFLNDEHFIPAMYSEKALVHEPHKCIDAFPPADLCSVIDKPALRCVSNPTIDKKSLKEGVENALKEGLVNSILGPASISGVVNQESFERFVGFIRDAAVDGEIHPTVECDMGVHCEGNHEWTDVFSPCGRCSFRVCGKCFQALLLLEKGQTVRATRFRCLCTKSISKDVLRQHNASNVAYQACGIASGLSNPSRIGISRCIGGARGKKGTYCVGSSVKMVEDGHARRCGDADVSRLDRLLDGDTKYQCEPCIQYTRAHPDLNQTSLFDMTDEDICALYEVGTPLRKCPHEGCGFPQEFWFGCGHVTCQKCEREFCFVCGMVWSDTHHLEHPYDIDNEYDGSLLYGTRQSS